MKRILALLLTMALVLGLFSGCGTEEEQAYVPTGDAILLEGQDPEDLLREEEEEQVMTLAYCPDRSMNPLIGNNHNNRVLFSLMYQGLFAVDAYNNTTPILCSAYQVSPDNMKYTFYVDDTATFSDGTPVTIEDVLASYEAAKTSNYYKGRFTHILAMSITEDGGISMILNTGYQNLPILLDIPIVKASEVEADFPLGTGPYAFSQGVSGAHLTRVVHWWSETEIPARSRVISLVEAADDAQVRDEFQFGDVSLVCTNPLAGNYAEYSCDYELWDVQNGVFLYLGCNVTYSEFFEDYDLQKVLTYAIDRNTINEKFYRGNGKVTTIPCSPDSPYYSSTLVMDYRYDPMKFIDLISDYKIPENKDGEDLKLRLLVNCDDSSRLRTARYIANTLTEYGLPCGTLEYSQNTSPTYEEVLRAQNFDLHLGQTKLPPTMDLSEFYRHYGNLNWGGITDLTIYETCMESLADSGNYYNLHKMVADSGKVIPILFGYNAVYARRGMFENLSPSRDNAFYYSIGKTMNSIKIATVYD